MPESSELDARLTRLEQALHELETRLCALEQGGERESVASLVARESWLRREAASRGDLAGPMALVGRTLLVVAGAYLLRALTAADVLERRTGAALGIVYAAAWTACAFRVAARHPLSATFFGVSSVLIGFPLIWEATTHFGLLAPPLSALTLGTLAGVALFTAWRQDLRVLAWVTVMATCVVAWVLLVVTGDAVPYTLVLILVGVATLWLGYDREWTVMRWFAAAFANVAVLALVGRALASPPRDAPAVVMLVQLTLLVGYLVSIVIRTLVRGRGVLPFEAMQTAALLVVSLGGAALVSRQSGAGLAVMGTTLLVLAAICYLVAFVRQWQAHTANRIFYSSLGLVFTLFGGTLAVARGAQGVTWLALGIAAALAAHRLQRRTLAIHAVIYLLAADITSGLAVTSVVGLFAGANTPWSPVTASAWMTLAGLALCCGLLAQSRGEVATSGARAVRLSLAVLVVIGVAGVTVVVARGAAALDANVVATLRTAVFAAIAVAVAWLGRGLATREFGLLLYPVLGLGAIKLIIEDLRTSPPLMLVVAFALYGGALIVGPRVARTRTR